MNTPYQHQDLERAIASCSASIAHILDRALAGHTLSAIEGEQLFYTQGKDTQALFQVADLIRQQRCGDQASFVITRNINFTNVCHMGCQFCNFGVSKSDASAEFFGTDEVVRRALEAKQRGATEICVQGGLHPDINADYYRQLLIDVKKAVPDIHIHAFSPFEIWYGARKAKLSYRDYLQELMSLGLASMPGTAAEILDTEVRRQLTKNKLSTEAWVEIIETAHQLGLPTTSTIMYGHVDSPRHWSEHIALLRSIQSQYQGFTEFVPLGFIHYQTPLYLENPDKVRTGPTRDEHFKMHAVARLMLQGSIDNIQASWVKMGPDVASQMLRAGANDLGGTLMNESISRAAGATHGQEIQPEDMVSFIHSAGLDAFQRNTLYQPLRHYPKPAFMPAQLGDIPVRMAV